jgi:hypothetical protein
MGLRFLIQDVLSLTPCGEKGNIIDAFRAKAGPFSAFFETPETKE